MNTNQLDRALTKQFILPLDEERDLRLQGRYQGKIIDLIISLRALVRKHVPEGYEQDRLLYGLAYTVVHLESQTLDMGATRETRCN